MLNKFLSKIGVALFTLWGIATLIFVLFRGLGDPVQILAGQRTDVNTLESIRKDLGLDKSPIYQYFNYLNDLSPLGFLSTEQKQSNNYSYISFFNTSLVLKTPYLGRSFQNNEKVWVLFFAQFIGTFILASFALLFAVIFGLFFGILSTLYYNSWLDKLLSFIALIGVSAPSFFIAVIMVWLFAIEWGNWTGLNISGYFYEEAIFTDEIYYNWKNLILPAITLGIRPLSVIFQFTRNNLLEVYSLEFIRTAKAKGLSDKQILFKHALLNALPGIVAVIANWFSSLIAGAFFIEYIFDWQGIGKLMVESLLKNDFPVVMGITLITGLIFVIINALSESIYSFLDPRMR